MEVCGNCGAPLDLGEDDECRWCRAKVRVRHPRFRRDPRRRPGISWKWNWRLGGIAGIAIAVAAGLGVGIFSYVGSHQYTVGVNQAFIVSSNPSTVLLISPSSTVMSMTLAQATAVRQHLAR